MPERNDYDNLLDALTSSTVTPELLREANELASKCYWEEKDGDRCHLLLRASMDAAKRAIAESLADAEELRAQYKSILYNMASYGWLGWDEQSITISPAFQASAVEAARAHFALAAEMNLPALKLSRAHWIAGALQIQEGRVDSARAHFEHAAVLAEQADRQGEAMNAQAFAFVCDALLHKPGAEESLNALLSEMRSTKDAADFADQAATALRVFRERAGGR